MQRFLHAADWLIKLEPQPVQNDAMQSLFPRCKKQCVFTAGCLSLFRAVVFFMSMFIPFSFCYSLSLRMCVLISFFKQFFRYVLVSFFMSFCRSPFFLSFISYVVPFLFVMFFVRSFGL